MKGDDYPVRISGIEPAQKEPLRDSLKTKLCKLGMPIIQYVENGEKVAGIHVWLKETPEGIERSAFENLIHEAFRDARCPAPTSIGIGV